MAARKPRIEYYWTPVQKPFVDGKGSYTDQAVNWRLVGANGEIMCQSTQGFRDKADAQRAVDSVALRFGGDMAFERAAGGLGETGPGRKPA